MYLECLSRVLDLPVGELLIVEARNKLTGSFGFVNGKLVYFSDFEFDRLWVRVFKNNKELPQQVFLEKEVEEISLWTPETGAYRTEQDGVIVLTKLPLRQWSKSFKAENYGIEVFDGASIGNYTDILPETRTEFWVSRNKSLMYLSKKIGTVVGDTYECIPLFKQDVEDWMKHGKEN